MKKQSREKAILYALIELLEAKKLITKEDTETLKSVSDVARCLTERGAVDEKELVEAIGIYTDLVEGMEEMASKQARKEGLAELKTKYQNRFPRIINCLEGLYEVSGSEEDKRSIVEERKAL